MTAEAIGVKRLLRMLATTGAALVLVVIVSSAFLRLDGVGLSCTDWPACYGRIDANATATSMQRVARIAHRIAATGVSAILLALALIAWTQRPPWVRQGTLAVVCLAIVLGLALLGIATPGTQLPAVTLGNLSGGFALLALLGWVRFSVSSPYPLLPDPPPWVRLLAALALLTLVVQIALGGMVSAQFAALACPSLPGCGVGWSISDLTLTLDPLRELVVGSDGVIVRLPALASLHFAHRVGAAVALTTIIVLAGRLFYARGRLRRFGAMLFALALGQVTLGAAAVLAQLPLALVVAHNGVAALLLVALVALNHGLNVRSEVR
jgi:cytochrome c oxidase assembly protein subunit 15